MSCLSTPFLWCLPKETVSSRQRKALFYPGGSTIRVSAAASVDGTFLARLLQGAGACRGSLRVRRYVGWLSLTCPAFRPHFFCLAKRNGVEPPKKSAFFYPGGSTIRVSAPASVDGTFLARLWGGLVLVWALYVCAVTLGGGRCPSLPFDPISLVLAQRNGVEPPKKSALKPPRHLGGPARLSHLGVSPNGTNWCVKLICTRWVDRALKSA